MLCHLCVLGPSFAKTPDCCSPLFSFRALSQLSQQLQLLPRLAGRATGTSRSSVKWGSLSPPVPFDLAKFETLAVVASALRGICFQESWGIAQPLMACT